MQCLVFIGAADVTVRPLLLSEAIKHLPPNSIRAVRWRPELPVQEKRREMSGLLSEAMDASVFQFIGDSLKDGMDLVSLVSELAMSNVRGVSRTFEFALSHERLDLAASSVIDMSSVTETLPSKTRCVLFSYVADNNEPRGFIRFLLALATARPSGYRPLECLSTIRESAKSRHFIVAAQWVSVPGIDTIARSILEDTIWSRSFRKRISSPNVTVLLDGQGIGSSEPNERGSVEWYLRERHLRNHVLPMFCRVVASTTESAKEFVELVQVLASGEIARRSAQFTEVVDDAIVGILEYGAQLDRQRNEIARLDSRREYRDYAQELAMEADDICPFPPLVLMDGMKFASADQRNSFLKLTQKMRTRIATDWQQQLRRYETVAENSMFEARELIGKEWKGRLLSVVPEEIQSEQREEVWPVKGWSGVIRLLERTA